MHLPPSTRAFTIRALVCAALIVAACGGDGAPGDAPGERTDERAAPGPLAACSLLTRGEAQEVLGEAPGDPVIGMEEPGDPSAAVVSQCTWPSGSSGRTVSILLTQAPTDQNLETAIEETRETLRAAGIAPREIDGAGEAAFWGGGELHVFSGQRLHILISVQGFDDEEAALRAARRAAGIALAKAA